MMFKKTNQGSNSSNQADAQEVLLNPIKYQAISQQKEISSQPNSPTTKGNDTIQTQALSDGEIKNGHINDDEVGK